MDSGTEEKQQSISPNRSDSQTSDIDSVISSDEETWAQELEMINVKSKGESFCDCHKKGREKECVCGEEDTCKIILNNSFILICRNTCIKLKMFELIVHNQD